MQVGISNLTSRVYTNSELPQISAKGPGLGEDVIQTTRNDSDAWRLTPLPNESPDAEPSALHEIEDVGPPFPRPDDAAFLEIMRSQTEASGMPAIDLPELPSGVRFTVKPPPWAGELYLDDPPGPISVGELVGMAIGMIVVSLVLGVGGAWLAWWCEQPEESSGSEHAQVRMDPMHMFVPDNISDSAGLCASV